MRRLLFNPLAAVLITGLVLLFWLSLHRTSSRIRSSTEAVTVLEQEVAKTASEISALESELAAAEDPFTVEQVARNELLLQLPGEIVLKLPDIASPEVEETQQQSQTTSIQAWLSVFLKKTI